VPGALNELPWAGPRVERMVSAEILVRPLDELVVGTICGGSDGTSGLTANPAIGRAADLLVDAGAAARRR